MKKVYYLFLSLLLLTYACSDDEKVGYKTATVAVQLVYPSESGYETREGVAVKAVSQTGIAYESETNTSGIAVFEVPVGLYEVSSTDKRKETGKSIVFTGVLTNMTVVEQNENPFSLNLTESVVSQIIIKEIYNGGCQKDDGSGTYHYDKYFVIYNNSDEATDLENLCVGMVLPYNSTVNNSDVQNGSLFYEAEGWIPAGLGYFYFSNSTILNPGEQIVVVLNNANDNTITYSNSIDLSKSEYYVT